MRGRMLLSEMKPFACVWIVYGDDETHQVGNDKREISTKVREKSSRIKDA